MVIDSHCHVGPAAKPGIYVPFGVSDGTADKLVAYLEENQIDMACAIPFPQIGIDNANNAVAEAVKKYPKKIIGYSTCNPWFKDAADTVRKCYEVFGLKGLKLHPVLHGHALSSHTLTDPVYETCADLGIPILSHGGDDIFNHPYEFEEMARTFPEVVQIIAHSGSMYLCDQARLVAKRNKNVFLDTAAVFSGDIRMAVETAGAEKVIMGSDWPTGSSEEAISIVNIGVQDQADRDLILGGNIARILGIS